VTNCRFSLVGMLILMAMLCACTVRPSSAVLQPSLLTQAPTQVVTVLVVTNREAATDAGFGARRSTQGLSYERYRISVPPQRRPAEIRYADAKPDPAVSYMVLSRESLSKAEFSQAAQQGISPDGTLGLFVHGYNQSYQEALFRSAQVQADSGMSTAILFSWPSEATLLGYLADRDASLASRSDLAETIEALALLGSTQRLAVAAHSMGAFLLMETLRQLKLQGKQEVLRRVGVILAAPDIDVEVFYAQMQTIGTMPLRMHILVSRNDRALAISRMLGSDRQRVGMVDVNDPRLAELAARFGVTVLDITSVPTPDRFAHDGFATMAQFARRLTLSRPNGRAGAADIGLFVFDASHTLLAVPASVQ
jgi:esterase/lipase superfamily enzyme